MKTVRTWCIRILMILFTIIFLYPLFWNLMSAFKTNAEYLTDPYALPVSLNLDNFVAAWQKANIAAYFGNSVFVTVLSTALLLLFVIPISYVLARYRFAGSKLISTFYLARTGCTIFIACLSKLSCINMGQVKALAMGI